MLQKLPGVTLRNYRRVLAQCECLADLAHMTLPGIQSMLGDAKQGASLFEFLHARCPTVTAS